MAEKMRRSMLPGRVQAALEYLDYCHWATHQCEASVPARGLGAAEERVLNAALEVLRAYFMCEMDFGDAVPRRDDDADGDEGPRVPEPVGT